MSNDINSKNEMDNKSMEKTQSKVIKKIEETLDEKKSMETGKKYNENPLNWYKGKLVIINSAMMAGVVIPIVFGDWNTKIVTLGITLSCLSVLTFLTRKANEKQKEWQEKQKVMKKQEELAQKIIDDFDAGNFYKAKVDSNSKFVEVTQTSEGNWKLVYKDKLIDNFSYEKEVPIK